ncbi:MAG TPA: hypothetical protein VGA99_00185, partial [bacterium]
EITGGKYVIIFGIAGSAYLIALAIIHLLVPRLETIEDPDKVTVSPFSLGSLLGFGFIGFIMGTFGGWCVGLLSNLSGQELLQDMFIGALIGAVIGIVVGNLLLKMGRTRAA